MAENTSNPLGAFLGIAQQFATPFAQSLVYGKSMDSEVALVKERADMERLNGSGPSNPDLAVAQSSKSFQDFLFGSPENRGTVGGSNFGLLLMVGAAILAVVLFIRR